MPLAEFCALVLSRRDHKARKLGNGIDPGDPAALHPLRIEIKKLRYSCEFFASLYQRKKSRDYLERLTALQEVLGDINDATVAVCQLQSLPGRAARPRDATAIGYLRGYLAAQSESRLAALARIWARFERARPYW
jgi:CHAD domain-containing protein